MQYLNLHVLQKLFKPSRWIKGENEEFCVPLIAVYATTDRWCRSRSLPQNFHQIYRQQQNPFCSSAIYYS
uniref:Uncharacterized protein n=1 Tax=Panagrolaimus sp. ES5 TaxID=591445 RepID=A0AC34FA50_9BILA